MTKKKSQKKFSSSTENPFNIKVNRSKHSILGQKVKGTRGQPGVSHSAGNARRKEEFHKKKIQSRKANKFLDKRLMDSSLPYEEQATRRLVEERKRKLKKNIFNLNDDESLTHKGVPLDHQKSLNEKFNDSDDDEAPLDADFVKKAHFGGFAEKSSTEPKSRKEIIDDLIVESKRRKMEKKMEREKNEDLIEKLDQKWKEMHHSLPFMKGKKQVTTSTTEEKDPFDIMLQELKYEMRATPAGKVKTPEEIAKEENEKIQQLEEQQLKRMMNPMDDAETKHNLLSADSIYDGLDIQFEPIDDQETENINTNVNENSDDEFGDDSSDDSAGEDELVDDIEENNDKSVSMSVDGDSDVPDTLGKFQSIIDNHNEEVHVIIDNILKDKIKGKSKKNVEKLEIFFGVLLEYLIQSSDNISKVLDILENILPNLYSLAETSPINTAVKLLEFLDKEQDLFQQSKGKKLKKTFPRFQSLMLLKIISSIYSVSDFKHQVVTPAIIFMCDIISNTFTISYQNTVTRLFVSKIIYDCVSLSRRYVPEIFWFFDKTLQLAMNNSKKFNLFIDEPVANEIRVDINFEKSDKSCSNVIKASIIFEVIELLCKFSSLYLQLESYKEIFSTSLSLVKRLPTYNYPNFLREAISKFIDAIENVNKTYKPLMFESKKPVPLKMLEPAFDSKFTRKKDDIQKKRKLIKNVNQKIRKEEKCLLREVRRDTQVVASEKLRETLEADAERKRKVKQLYSELASQEGEYKKFVKKK